MCYCVRWWHGISIIVVFVVVVVVFFFQAEDGIRDWSVTGVQTCALPISMPRAVSCSGLRVSRSVAGIGMTVR